MFIIEIKHVLAKLRLDNYKNKIDLSIDCDLRSIEINLKIPQGSLHTGAATAASLVTAAVSVTAIYVYVCMYIVCIYVYRCGA